MVIISHLFSLGKKMKIYKVYVFSGTIKIKMMEKEMGEIMQAYTYVSEGKFELREKSKPVLMHERDAIVKVTLASICSSDLHIKHGSVPRAVPGITVGHEMVGIVESVGSAVTKVKPGDRVTVNVETFCGECFFCKKGYVNNCTDKNGGWAVVLMGDRRNMCECLLQIRG